MYPPSQQPVGLCGEINIPDSRSDGQSLLIRSPKSPSSFSLLVIRQLQVQFPVPTVPCPHNTLSPTIPCPPQFPVPTVPGSHNSLSATVPCPHNSLSPTVPFPYNSLSPTGMPQSLQGKALVTSCPAHLLPFPHLCLLSSPPEVSLPLQAIFFPHSLQTQKHTP